MKYWYAALFLILFNYSYSQDPQTVISTQFRAWVLNTDFNLPAIRFTPFYPAYREKNHSMGRLSVFNSVGAGFSLNRGIFTELVDAQNPEEVISSQMKNRFGVHLGMLFSYPNDSLKSFVFAPTLGLQLLDIQFGWGYELGTIQTGERRMFYTLAYRIPIKKLYNISYIRMKQRSKKDKKKKDQK